MSKRRNGSPVPLLLTVAAIALAAGLWLSYQLASKSGAPGVDDMAAITVLPQPRALPAVALVDHHARPFGIADLAGEWSLLFMGFTNCGHVCPMTMAKLRIIQDGVEKPLRVLFLSVDPGRDSPAKIHDYITSFGERFTGISGEPAEIDSLASALGAPYFVDDTEGAYTVNHSSALFLIDPSAAYAGVISQPLDLAAIVAELDGLMLDPRANHAMQNPRRRHARRPLIWWLRPLVQLL
ncbi:MAG: SCO family protein [Gammaproteobacteria bacterium]|nr:SCO family protein [Gammaproteobacteria bacterium]MBT8443229.1 SCO family protein [Gammaproteobacteria bacterium]NND37294.1 SCO family protein [Gammaproteobacteria bacterium]